MCHLGFSGYFSMMFVCSLPCVCCFVQFCSENPGSLVSSLCALSGLCGVGPPCPWYWGLSECSSWATSLLLVCLHRAFLWRVLLLRASVPS